MEKKDGNSKKMEIFKKFKNFGGEEKKNTSMHQKTKSLLKF